MYSFIVRWSALWFNPEFIIAGRNEATQEVPRADGVIIRYGVAEIEITQSFGKSLIFQ
jgi:hypothetical protein